MNASLWIIITYLFHYPNFIALSRRHCTYRIRPGFTHQELESRSDVVVPFWQGILRTRWGEWRHFRGL